MSSKKCVKNDSVILNYLTKQCKLLPSSHVLKTGGTNLATASEKISDGSQVAQYSGLRRNVLTKV